jgi:hypothetical protein
VKVFHCDHCRHLLFFENTQCVKCGHLLAFLPELMIVGSLDRSPRSTDEGAGLWTSPLRSAAGRSFRLCANYEGAGICNWAVDADDDDALCVSCRLTTVIPDLSVAGHREAWFKLEAAKRRLLYTLLTLGLPLGHADTTLPPLTFQFLADDDPQRAPVLTGHAGGVITINLGEADDAERERRRTALGEPYRTLLGHMRHESGHYYWSLLVERQAARLEHFRGLFGDDRREYGGALQQHYAAGPPPDWRERFVTAYAAAHPWEDWAETWAHYLHMVDTLETAASCGVSLQPPRADEPRLAHVPSAAATQESTFERLLDSWFPVTYMLNNLNRGLGLADPYPFVLSMPAIEKLAFVHEAVGLATKAGRHDEERPIPSA